LIHCILSNPVITVLYNISQTLISQCIQIQYKYQVMSGRGKGRGRGGRGKGHGSDLPVIVRKELLTPEYDGRMARYCVWCGVVVPNQALFKTGEFETINFSNLFNQLLIIFLLIMCFYREMQ